MERLRLHAFILAGVLLIGGSIIQMRPKVQKIDRTEEWMISQLPNEVDGLKFVEGSDTPGMTYRMDKSTYDVLQPYGIVSRVYGSTARGFDVVIISSNKRGSFHDPQVCFTAQGWRFLNTRVVTIPTHRGPIQASYIEMRHKSGRETSAVYFFRGLQFYPAPLGLTLEMVRRQLLGSTEIEGTMYRFIAVHPEPTLEEYIDFIQKYLKAADESSNGYY